MSTTLIYQDQTPEARLELLAKNCLRNQVGIYAVSLNDAELNAERSAYAQLGINLDKLEEEKKEEAAKFTTKIKEIKALMAAGLGIIKNGKKSVEGKLFYFADQESGKMKAYDKHGELINSRDLVPAEKNTQLAIGDNLDQIDNGAPNENGGEAVAEVKETLKETKARKKKEAAAAKNTNGSSEENAAAGSETTGNPGVAEAPAGAEAALTEAPAIVPVKKLTKAQIKQAQIDQEATKSITDKAAVMTSDRKKDKARIDAKNEEEGQWGARLNDAEQTEQDNSIRVLTGIVGDPGTDDDTATNMEEAFNPQ